MRSEGARLRQRLLADAVFGEDYFHVQFLGEVFADRA